MSKKKILGAAISALAFLEYRRHKATESFGWFAYAPLTDQIYNPVPEWVTNPKNLSEAIRADLYIARYDARQVGDKLRRLRPDTIYLDNSDGRDLPVLGYPKKKLSPELVADLRAWAAHYHQHATDRYEFPTSEWDSTEALECHLKDEEALYTRLRAEVPFWRRIEHFEEDNVVSGRHSSAKHAEEPEDDGSRATDED